MIIYNLTIKVDEVVHIRWLHWMKTEHFPRMMAGGLLRDYRICHLLEQDEQDGVTYVIQYMLDSPDQFRRYEQAHAIPLQEELRTRFGGRCVTFHTLMEVID